MDFINLLLINHSALQAIIVVALICALGLALGKIKIWGISLGVTFVFFVGIIAGHLGFTIEHETMNYIETAGLVLFVYALGLQVGPGFFSAFRSGGFTLNMLGILLVLTGTLFAIILGIVFDVNIPDIMGVMCGATTNTPALAALQQTLIQSGEQASTPALGCAVTYPLGVVGVILATIIMRKLFVKSSDIRQNSSNTKNKTYISAFKIQNPAIYNKNVKEVAQMSHLHFVISRLWRDGKVSIPTGDTKLTEGDKILVVTSVDEADALTLLFGVQEHEDWNAADIDWNAIDSQLISQRILVTRPEINGKRLGSLKLRNHYGINISRVYRAGVLLLADPDLRLQLGDRLTVVGEKAAVHNVEAVLGNAVKSLKEPNLISIFIGIILGLVIGAIPIPIPGMASVKLGYAGGPIIMGIIVGTFGPRLHMITYTTQSANLMLRSLGLSLYLACLGLDSGVHFFETVFRAEGAIWIALGFAITVIPVILIGLISLKQFKIDFGTSVGMLCGAMANPMALNYANDTLPGDNTSVAYATVYPLSMFARVIIVQIVVLMML
ncbi:MAG: putative transporter [Bacteroidales bacterium]|nr:putative transporter [Bacteroidales bacterium]